MKTVHFADQANGRDFSLSRHPVWKVLSRGRRFRGVGIFLLCGLILLGGCATQAVQLRGEVSASATVGARKVFVVTDPAAQPIPTGDQLVTMVQTALREQGFEVVLSDADADLVILPFFTLLQGQEGFTPILMPPAFRAQDWNDTGGNILEGRRGTPSNVQNTFVPTSRIGLMVTAIARETWSTLPPDDVNVPRVWRVTATTASPVGSEQKYLPVLVQAAASVFGKKYKWHDDRTNQTASLAIAAGKGGGSSFE